MVRDLGFDVEIVAVPTVREDDGLALSSRNAFLGAEARQQAPVLRRALLAAERAVAAGERESAAILAIVGRELAKAPLAEPDYVELRDPDTLEPVPARLAGPALLALAVRFPAPSAARGVRLIDNAVLRPAAPQEDPA
jgi:pantoate--beta-alanine ligase